MDTIRLLKTIHKHTHTSPSAAPKKKNKSCVFQFSGQDLPERPSSSGYEEHRGYTLKKGLETKRVMHHLGLFLNPITITDVTVQAQQGKTVTDYVRLHWCMVTV